MRRGLRIVILCSTILGHPGGKATADDLVKQSAAIKQVAGKRSASIDAELARLGPEHAWAGKYYYGDGLGVNVNLAVAPESGFVFEWEGCLGLYDRNYGSIRLRDDRLQLSCELRNDAKGGFGAIPTDFTPIRWGGRHYLIPSEQLIGFCNAVNSREEPRNEAHGSFLLREGDEKQSVSGAPKLPPAYSRFLLEHPIIAEVNKVEPSIDSSGKGGTHWRYIRTTLNVGSSDGVYKGLEFYLVAPDEVQSTEVEALSEKSSTVVFKQDPDSDPLPQVGWKLSTLPAWRRNP
jgi:hypothetical protein